MRIEEVKEASKKNAPIAGNYVISKCELKPFKAKEGFFLQCELTDKTGSIRGIIWDEAEKFSEKIQNRSPVKILGESTRYNDIPQVVIKKLEILTEFNPSDFVPDIGLDKRKEMAEKMEAISKTIENPTCSKIWGYILGARVMPKLFECPGGVGDVHHNYLGGLMEHSLSMIDTAGLIHDSNPKLDRNILLTGCMIHDIGKILAYNWKIVIEMNDIGRLLHHTYLGFGISCRMAQDLGIEPENIEFIKLQHIIVSHHEELGVRKPMFPEAAAVATIDAMDAVVNHSIKYIEDETHQDPGTNWTKFCHLTQRQYYCPKSIKIEYPEMETSKKQDPETAF